MTTWLEEMGFRGSKLKPGHVNHYFLYTAELGEPEASGDDGKQPQPPRSAEVAAHGVPGGRHDLPGGERDGAPAGVPLPPFQPLPLAARLRRHRRHDRRLLLPARVLRLPGERRRAARLPVGDRGPRRARRGGAARASTLVAAAPRPPRGALRLHGPLRRRAGAARAVAQLGPPGVLPRHVAGARHGARLRRWRRLLRRPRAGAVAAGEVRLCGAQPPDLPRARARRRAHALRRHRHPHQLARGGGRRRHRNVGAVVTCTQTMYSYCSIMHRQSVCI